MSKEPHRPAPITESRSSNPPASGARTADEADAARRGVEDKRDSSGDKQNMVGVVALRTFAKDGNPLSEDVVRPGDEFECERGRAGELRANGLVRYQSDNMDEEMHGKVDAGRIQQSVEQSDKLREIPKNAKGTPLRNPEIKFADVKDDDK